METTFHCCYRAVTSDMVPSRMSQLLEVNFGTGRPITYTTGIMVRAGQITLPSVSRCHRRHLTIKNLLKTTVNPKYSLT